MQGHAFELESSIATTRDRHTQEIVRASKSNKTIPLRLKKQIKTFPEKTNHHDALHANPRIG